MTLRPCPSESKDWDTTENLYIEGDNLRVMKLLQENYLGAIKMIYIDPPYNTGSDFIYPDIILHGRDGNNVTCSVESSISVYKNKMEDILETFHLASKRSEIRQVNIQVYFWLNPNGYPRVCTPSNTNVAIIGWAGNKELLTKPEKYYPRENRRVIEMPLKELSPMEALLNWIT